MFWITHINDNMHVNRRIQSMEEIKFLKDGSRFICIADGISAAQEKRIRSAFSGVNIEAPGLLPMSSNPNKEQQTLQYVDDLEPEETETKNEPEFPEDLRVALNYQYKFHSKVKGVYQVLEKIDAAYAEIKKDTVSPKSKGIRYAICQEILRVVHLNSYDSMKPLKIIRSMPNFFHESVQAAISQDGVGDDTMIPEEDRKTLVEDAFHSFLDQNQNIMYTKRNNEFD